MMYDPHGGLEDDFAEWIELYNPTAETIDLSACFVVDEANLEPLEQQAELSGIAVTAGETVLLGRSQDQALNGGLAFDATFEFGLSNGGDVIILSCDGVELDRVAYDDGEVSQMLGRRLSPAMVRISWGPMRKAPAGVLGKVSTSQSLSISVRQVS